MGGEPIAYAVDMVGREPVDIASLQRSLVFRADAPYLVVLEPGQLTVFSLGSDALAEETPRAHLTVRHNELGASATFQRLFHTPERPVGSLPTQTIHERLFGLLSETVDELVDLGLDRNDALSLSGRAMFTRFLVDRSILKAETWPDVARRASGPTEFFATPSNASSTCRWLDSTFNGDFLPLSFRASTSIFGRFPARVFENLSDIMQCRRGKQLFFQWEDVDLSSVPAGLLSQVYEHQAERWNPYSRHKTGVYYTPRRIADYMVSEIVASIRAERPDSTDTVRVLDPAVGGGVFLVAFLRELVSERWRRLGRAPTSLEIRAILYKQLVGFDISEPALRLTSLSLYLTALELDPDPQPLSALKFEPLRGRVLFDVKEPGAVAGGAILGSLRNQPAHTNKFDVVIANPPWTALTGSVSRQIERELNNAVRDKLLADQAPIRLPDKVPDIGFLWFATTWAKENAWIAMALHARVLFKQSPVGIEARDAIFRHLDVTGIMNGSELRTTEVWPEMSAPFCLLFARNRRPPDRSALFFVSPVQERGINVQGRFRIDAESANPVSAKEVCKTPTLLKTLFRGSPLDVALLRHVSEIGRSLKTYWGELELASGQGYQVGTSAREDATILHGMPDLGSRKLPAPIVKVGGLPAFDYDRVHRVRDPAIYKAPIVLVRKSPPSLSRRRASRASAIALEDVAYSESFYGWSAYGHPSGEAVAQYLFLLLNSDLFLWHSLVTSSEFGVERESIQKDDVDSFPIRRFDELDNAQRSAIATVFERYSKQPGNTKELNRLVAGIYELSKWHSEIIADTLETRLPYRANVDRADAPPSAAELDAFVARLEDLLRSSLDPAVTAKIVTNVTLGPWQLLLIERSDGGMQVPSDLQRHLRLADHTGVSRVLVRWEDGKSIGVCLLRQRRYWTLSRARLLALTILHQHQTLWR